MALSRGRRRTNGPEDPFVAATSTEFLRWRQQQVVWWRRGAWDAMRDAPHPAPDADHGLPDGWVAVGSFTAPEGIVWCLSRRRAGGWLLVSHDPSSRETALSGAEETLAGLFATILRARERVGGQREVTDWLKGVISAMYDPTDPNEAAEQVLFALTDKIRTPPRAAT